MTKTEQIIRTVLGSSLSRRVLAKIAKERKRKLHRDAVEEIQRVNGGYFVRPEASKRSDDELPFNGPEQLRFKLDTE